MTFISDNDEAPKSDAIDEDAEAHAPEGLLEWHLHRPSIGQRRDGALRIRWLRRLDHQLKPCGPSSRSGKTSDPAIVVPPTLYVACMIFDVLEGTRDSVVSLWARRRGAGLSAGDGT